MMDIIKNFKTIIDIERPLQKGLTMRTIEMLGTNKKIITTNNIFIIDRNNPIIDEIFLNKEYQEIDKNIH